MKLTNPGQVPVYTVAGPSSQQLPDWLATKRKRQLKNDPEWANRVTLLQDFEFEEASNCIAVSPDQQWVMSTGTYKPQIHVHNLEQLSLSFSRHTTSLCRAFAIVSDDYSKSLHLQEDRSVELHTKGGMHMALRIPRYGRDLIYDSYAAEALVPSVGLGPDGFGEVFRLNLELGRFMQSYQVEVGSDESVENGGIQGGIDVGSVNTAAIAEKTHGLLAFGTSIGTVEFFDPRSKGKVATLQAHDGEITALNYSPSGLGLATGSSSGIVQLYDLRRPRPLLTKDQGFGFPIKKLVHMVNSSEERKILSMDKKIIKIFDESNGDPWVSIEPSQDLNDIAWVKNTGMLLTANEGPQQHAFHIPQLGPAPAFCTFLDNMVEEMAEEVRTETYQNVKFLTIAELRSLSLEHLIGKSNLLRPYMHGYWVDSKLYDQARLIANPYIFEEERMKRVQDKIEKERASRIRGNKKVKVNQKMVDKLLKKQENRAEVDTEAGMLGDSRFKGLFEDEDFKIDETSREYLIANPSGATAAMARGEGADDNDSGSDTDNSETREESTRRKRKEGFVMHVSSSSQKGRRDRDSALGSREQKTRVNKSRLGNAMGGGERSVTFVPESKKKRESSGPTDPKPKRNDQRRSASSNTFRKL